MALKGIVIFWQDNRIGVALKSFPVLLLAVGVIYHPVDVDTVTGIHGQDKGKPACAEIGAGLDPGGTETGNKEMQ